MPSKALINDIKDAAESVRLLEEQGIKARTLRSRVFLEAASQGMTYSEIAKIAQVSEHTVQADLRAARNNR